MVYELSTGNNSVQSLAWDDANDTLYAATECFWVDRMGYRHDYRELHQPRKSGAKSTDEDDEEDEDEDDEEWGEDRAWPSDASHSENAFGIPHDAGEHRLCESCTAQFKPSTLMLRLFSRSICLQRCS